MSILTSYIGDLIYSITNCINCFPSSPSLKINGRSFKILRLLGEGGFSYVYLVQSTSPTPSSNHPSNTLYALKKIRCPFGAESVSNALREVEAYSLFSPHPNIIHAIDHAVVSDSSASAGLSGIGRDAENDGAGAKTVYILLPYFERGNLQDMINANLVNRTRISEKRLLRLMRGVCEGLRAMHKYKVPHDSSNAPANSDRNRTRGLQKAKAIRAEAVAADHSAAVEFDAEAETAHSSASEDEDEEEGLTATGEVAATANSSRRRRHQGPAIRSSGRRRGQQDDDDDEEEPLMDDDITQSQVGVAPGKVRAYAHRDIKPGNIMLTLSPTSPTSSSSGTPLLMDLGSLAPSPTPIPTRSAALALSDHCAETCTLPYRAPELFDPKTGTEIDTKVDIWSLGCTIYACLVGKSPFEKRSEDTGGSLTMCILGGDWRFPDEGADADDAKKVQRRATGQAQGQGDAAAKDERVLSPRVKELIRQCLRVEPSERPDVDGVVRLIEGCLAQGAEGNEDEDD